MSDATLRTRFAIVDGEDLPDVLTTGDVARICQVAPRTASKWIDSGDLEGYRLPGSKDRRTTRAQFVRFLNRRGMLDLLRIRERDGGGDSSRTVDPEVAGSSPAVELDPVCREIQELRRLLHAVDARILGLSRQLSGLSVSSPLSSPPA